MNNDELDFTVDELLSELDAQFRTDKRLPTDLDREQIVAKFGCSYCTATNRMKQLVASGKWKEIRVFEKGRYRFVYRKVTDGK